MRRFFAVLLALLALATPLAFAFQYRIPSFSWFYFLEGKGLIHLGGGENGLLLGWITGPLASLAALWLAWRIWRGGLASLNPVTLRRLERFRRIRRGLVSLWIVLGLMVLALLDMVVVGQRALLVVTEKGVDMPAFRYHPLPRNYFGLEGKGPTDYRELKADLAALGRSSTVILPVIPWEPTSDSDVQLNLSLQRGADDLLRGSDGKLFSGVATSYHDEALSVRARQVRVRGGMFQGVEERYDEGGKLRGYVRWVDNQVFSLGSGIVEGEEVGGVFTETLFNPIAPNVARRHWLGTDSRGWDVAAQLFGGWQVLLRGLVIYLVVVYALGILVGTAMGYFGGIFDILMHRLTEILSAVPLILLIMILGAQLGPERMGIVVLVGLFCLFRWVGVALYLRTLTYREKARDYVAAAKSLGAGTGRILWKHVLPNTVALIVTLLPFEIVFFSGFLTSLDFIGYGLPERFPSWGRLMSDGLGQLAAPWIVSSVFGMLVITLLLFTFIGEAVREAFDPKKFSTYR